MRVYSQPEIIQLLETNLQWREYTDDNMICATYEFHDFLESVAFVNDIAEIAETTNHHPDIDIRYNVVSVATCTHDMDDAITEKDIAIALQIEKLVE